MSNQWGNIRLWEWHPHLARLLAQIQHRTQRSQQHLLLFSLQLPCAHGVGAGKGGGGRGGGGQASQKPTPGPWVGTASIPCRVFVWALTLAFRPVTQQHSLRVVGTGPRVESPAVFSRLPQPLPPSCFYSPGMRSFTSSQCPTGREHVRRDPHVCHTHACLHTRVQCTCIHSCRLPAWGLGRGPLGSCSHKGHGTPPPPRTILVSWVR